jgi:hypothetical protein
MRYQTLAIAAAALLTFSASASAQQAAPAKLQIGAWSGKVTQPDGQSVDVKYDISYAGDTLKIKINAAEHGSFDTWDAKVEADKLSFKFRPGPEVSCVLNKLEKSYSGTCTAEDGSAATMDLSPPKKEGE